jgi:rubredoxin
VTVSEQIIDARKTNEIDILSGYVQRMGSMTCARVAWKEFDQPPHDCECPSCLARETLATIATMFEVYHVESLNGTLDIRRFGQA